RADWRAGRRSRPPPHAGADRRRAGAVLSGGSGLLMSRYLFTSSSKTVGGVFLLDSRTREIRRVLDGPFRGMAEGPDGHFYVVSGYRDPADGYSVFYRLDRESWVSEKLAEYPIGDCHYF